MLKTKDYFHLLILLLLINLSTCNWLRLGILGINLPDQEYNEQFTFNQPLRNHLQLKKMHPINDTHQHRINHRKLNSTLTKYLNSTDVFLNDFTKANQTIRDEYDSILSQLNDAQLKFVKKNPNSLNVISTGVSLAIEQCTQRFEKERWNCSIEDEKEVLGQTLKRANRESAFVQAIVSAGVAYSLTRACSTGNLENCACDYKFERYSDIESSNKQGSNWHWTGCSDNLSFGIKLAKQFLNSEFKQSSAVATTKNRVSLRDYMQTHNSKAGIDAIRKLMRLKCRCHGSSGSCSMKTCWKVLPKFNEIGKYLKKKYRQSIHIEGIVSQGAKNFKLKRSKRALTSSLSTIKHLKRIRNQDSETIQISQKVDKQSQFYNELPEIELNSNSFIVNRLVNEEKKIDEDDDYDDEEDGFDNSKNKQINDQSANKVINRQIDEIDLEFQNLIPNLSTSKPIVKPTIKSTDKSSEATSRSTSKPASQSSKSTSKPTSKSTNKPTNNQMNKSTNKPTNNPTNKSTSKPNTSKPIYQIPGNLPAQTAYQSPSSRPKPISKKSIANQLPDQSGKWFTPNKSDLVYIHKSPNYCLRNNELSILGTGNRTCRLVNTRRESLESGNCESLCCGRGFDRRMIRKSERCNCEYDIATVEVKCKTCEYTLEMNTCK